MATLDIYYDNPTKASDMYLKYLKKDCEANGIKVRVIDDLYEWLDNDSDADLYLEPTKNMPQWVKDTSNNIDSNIDSPSATAQGIRDYIVENYPQRDKTILVIGRGLVGKDLVDMLMEYGYTVIEVNSKTKRIDLSIFALYSDIIVGVSSKDNIFDKDWCERLNILHKVLIDASNNFDTHDKLRCGRWTRNVIVKRVLEKAEYNKELRENKIIN